MLDNGVGIALDGCVWGSNPLDDGVGIALDGCVWVFMGRLLEDGVGIALDGCIWVFMGDESISHYLIVK